MSETPKTPELADLVAAAEPTGKQKFANFFGLGYGGNTAVSVVSVNIARKVFPGLVAKWEGHHTEKYYARKAEELISPIADQLDEKSRAALEGRIRKEAEAYGRKTVDSRLLSTGGFAMLPFQSAMQIRDYSRNVKPYLDDFRKDAQDYLVATQGPMDEGVLAEKAENMLKAAVKDRQDKVVAGDQKSRAIYENALKEPEFSPLGTEARNDLPKWAVGRVVALAAAFVSQSIVDDKFSKKKDTLDNALAKVFTRIVHPKGYDGGKVDNQAFKEQAGPISVPEGVDPKILNTVRMVTTDAYMTTVAIGTHMATMNVWDKRAPDAMAKFKDLQNKVSNMGAGRGVGAPS